MSIARELRSVTFGKFPIVKAATLSEVFFFMFSVIQGTAGIVTCNGPRRLLSTFLQYTIH
jgi:hypothetical protein